jgi:Na+-driven multidrug efflux pump
MQRGRPGLVVALVRYVGLTVPLCWLGLGGAAVAGQPPFYGILLGLIVVAAIASGLFYGWLWKVLLRLEGIHPFPRTPAAAPGRMGGG